MAKLIVSAIAFVVFGLVSDFSHAEEEFAPGYEQCVDRAKSTVDLIECETTAYQYWDKILGINYKKQQENCKSSERPDECKQILLKAQRLWIQYKEAMVPVIINAEGDGSLSRLSANHFLASETRKQAQLLQVVE